MYENNYVEVGEKGTNKVMRLYHRNGLYPIAIGIEKLLANTMELEPNTEGYYFQLMSVEDAKDLVEKLQDLIERVE